MTETDLAPQAAQIEATFTHIATTRMAGIPVLNPALTVALRGFQLHGAHRLGVLITPWFMNLIAFATAEEAPARVGAKMMLALPSGAYEAIRGHEDSLGAYWSVSLFSPMGDFADMDTAIATADAALAELLAAPEPAPEPEPAPKPPVSRRALFGLRAPAA